MVTCVFRVDLWNASNLKFGDEFLGEVRVPLKMMGQSGVHDAWYFLQPRNNGNKSVKADELGSLRLNIIYTEDHVFPTEHYNPLRDLLLQSAHLQVSDEDLVSVCPVCSGVTLLIRRDLSLVVLIGVCLCRSPSRRPQLISWARCVVRSRRRPFLWCDFSCTTAKSCLSSAPSPTPRSAARSEFTPGLLDYYFS